MRVGVKKKRIIREGYYYDQCEERNLVDGSQIRGSVRVGGSMEIKVL
jgi:hypothetical protein